MKGLEKKIVDLRLEVVSGQKIYAAKNASDQNWGVTSSCGDGFVVIGYYCEIESGGGLLQNIGVRNNMYHCLWANVSGNFRAYGQAACLRIQQK